MQRCPLRAAGPTGKEFLLRALVSPPNCACLGALQGPNMVLLAWHLLRLAVGILPLWPWGRVASRWLPEPRLEPWLPRCLLWFPRPVVGFRTEAPAWNCMVPSLIAACDVNCWQDRCHCLDLFGSKTLNSLAEAKHPCCWCLRQMGRSDNTAPIVLGRFIALAGTAAAGALCCRRFGKRQSLACRQDAKGAGRSGTPRGYMPKGAATQASWLLRTFRKNRKICLEIF